MDYIPLSQLPRVNYLSICSLPQFFFAYNIGMNPSGTCASCCVKRINPERPRTLCGTAFRGHGECLPWMLKAPGFLKLE